MPPESGACRVFERIQTAQPRPEHTQRAFQNHRRMEVRPFPLVRHRCQQVTRQAIDFLAVTDQPAENGTTPFVLRRPSIPFQKALRQPFAVLGSQPRLAVPALPSTWEYKADGFCRPGAARDTERREAAHECNGTQPCRTGGCEPQGFLEGHAGNGPAGQPGNEGCVPAVS